jgi:hypothetical protein
MADCVPQKSTAAYTNVGLSGSIAAQLNAENSSIKDAYVVHPDALVAGMVGFTLFQDYVLDWKQKKAIPTIDFNPDSKHAKQSTAGIYIYYCYYF